MTQQRFGERGSPLSPVYPEAVSTPDRSPASASLDSPSDFWETPKDLAEVSKFASLLEATSNFERDPSGPEILAMSPFRASSATDDAEGEAMVHQEVSEFTSLLEATSNFEQDPGGADLLVQSP